MRASKSLSLLFVTSGSCDFGLYNPFGASGSALDFKAMGEPPKYSLPALPYAYDALEPAISSQIMTLHHTKHHQTYITNLNAALGSLYTALAANDIPSQIDGQQAIKFNGGGHINHSLFWQNLSPPGTTSPKDAPKLLAAIESQWGSYASFEAAFSKALLGIQGSGWGWLVRDTEGTRLSIVTTKDQDPVAASEIPIFGVDMWEHAYYLQYLNAKPEYVKGIWTVINWKVAETRFGSGRGDVFEVLKAGL